MTSPKLDYFLFMGGLHARAERVYAKLIYYIAVLEVADVERG
jgi:hypothetical protein